MVGANLWGKYEKLVERMRKLDYGKQVVDSNRI